MRCVSFFSIGRASFPWHDRLRDAAAWRLSCLSGNGRAELSRRVVPGVGPFRLLPVCPFYEITAVRPVVFLKY